MTVYIEYAFLQNFLLDGGLLWLACSATKTPVKWARLFFASLFGGVFALLYPLLHLTAGLGVLLKISVGFLLCMIAFGRLKSKKEWGKYSLFSALFFGLSFCFGGGLLGWTQGLSVNKTRAVWTPLAFLLFLCAVLFFAQKVYKKRSVWRYIYECKIVSGEHSARVRGFFDSGNIATKNGIPVCFLSAETVYELWGNEIVFGEKGRGQVCDEMEIATMTGMRRVPLYKGELEIKTGGEIRRVKEVYFALSTNMISREYHLILHSRIFG